MSCEAAVRTKPKARLCEPWVNDLKAIEPRRGDSDQQAITATFATNALSPPRGSQIY
jgi:hypothetical protein